MSQLHSPVACHLLHQGAKLLAHMAQALNRTMYAILAGQKGLKRCAVCMLYSVHSVCVYFPSFGIRIREDGSGVCSGPRCRCISIHNITHDSQSRIDMM